MSAALTRLFERHAEEVLKATGQPLRVHYVSPETYSRLLGEFYAEQGKLCSPDVAEAARKGDGGFMGPRLEIAGVPVKVLANYWWEP